MRPRGAVSKESTLCTRVELTIGNRCGGPSWFALRYLFAAAAVELDKIAPTTVELPSSRRMRRFCSPIPIRETDLERAAGVASESRR